MIARLVCVLLVVLCGAASAQAPQFRIGPVDLNQPGKKKASEEAQKIATRALAAFSKNDLETARKDFLRVLELAPNNLSTLINLGLVEYRQKKFADAETLLKSAVKSAPDSGLPWLVLGVVQYEQKKLDAARVPCGIVKSVPEAIEDAVGASPLTGMPSSVGGRTRLPPPRLDEHGQLIRDSGWSAFARYP